VLVYTATLAPHDAVSDQARRHAAMIAEWGYRALLVAERWHPSCAGEVVPLRNALALGNEAAWVVHYGIWSEGVGRIAERSSARKVFVYHNVTPAELLPPGRIHDLCLRARLALPTISGAWDLVLSDSAASLRDLAHAGFRPAEVIPLLMPEPEPVEATEREDSVLFVGRVAPSKGLAELVKAFALLRLLHRPATTLRIVGSAAGWERYAAGLERLALRTECGGVSFLGQVDDRDRDLEYARAGVFCTLSRHEGFCAPLVEAMRLGTPVVAAEAGAIGETLGGGGLLLPRRDPALVAEALAAALDDHGLRERLAARAGAATERFAPSAVAARLRDLVDPLLTQPGE
jgi:glycosyltransferase involved in cell wall biosynthesis